MDIYIPTRGRVNDQKTLRALTPRLRALSCLVVDHNEEEAHLAMIERTPIYREAGVRVRALPPDTRGISRVRQFIMDSAPRSHLVMLDDDLTLHTKAPLAPGPDNGEKKRKIVAATPADVERMFLWLEHQLAEGWVHASITPRFLNWNTNDDEKRCTRMMHVLAYNRDRVREADCSFTKGVSEEFSMDDFHMTLQLLRAGFPNVVNIRDATNPSASNARGGASEWRTLDSHNKSALKLKELHGDLVRVSAKQGWQGMDGERLDVTVAWQKALKKGE